MNKTTFAQPKPDAEPFVEEVFRRYRSRGFPFYSYSPEKKWEKLKRLVDYDHTDVLVGRTIRQTMHGLGLAWSYFPHAWSVRCGSMKTPMEVFQSDEDFRGAIAKRLKYGTGIITDAAIRKALRSFSGTQGVSNFRPTAAAAVYHTFLPRSGGTVWDMSAGFGGRLLGAIACKRVLRYVGTDPCTRTMIGLLAMARELGRDGLDIELHKVGSEDFVPEPESLDLAFSSPPYFDTEKYSSETTQSYLRFPERREWLHGFLGATLDHCWFGLKPTGRLIVNIANVKSYPTLECDFVTMARARNWKLEQTIRYALSKMMGTRQMGGSPFKFEPVFVFKKNI